MHPSHLTDNIKLNQAVQLAQSGKLTEASALCQQILQEYPSNDRAWHLQGLTAMQQGQQQQALTSLQKAIALNPSKAEFHNHAGVVHFNLGNLEQGIACLQKALALQPQSIDTRYNLALGYQKLGRLSAARKEYQQLIYQQPNYVPALVQLGIISQQQQQYQDAIAFNRQAIAIKPQNAQAWCNLAGALQETEKITEAQRAFQRALAINPQYVEASSGLGTLLKQQSQANQAIIQDQQAEESLMKTNARTISKAIETQQDKLETTSFDSVSFQPSVPNPLLTQSQITCKADAGFQAWLAKSEGSLAISTYQAGNVAIVGWNGQQVSLLMRQFSKPMGMALQDNRFALATKHEVILFANAPNLAYHYLLDQPGRYDALYLPRACYFTGDINVHDLAFGDEGLWLVNTRFSCLSVLSQEFSFVPRWQPPFISQLAPEDRCHLNGLAMVNGKPKYVTALGESDQVGGWRSQKADGGILMDVETGDILLRGLSMPHSPRWHQGALWFLNSGQGELCRFDPKTGKSHVVCTLPGFGRGLCLIDNYALLGLSQIREHHIFGGLPIEEKFKQLICGVAVVDCHSGQQIGLFEFASGVQELYEVQFISGRTRPTILNTEMSAVRDAFTAPDFAYWLRPEFLMDEFKPKN